MVPLPPAEPFDLGCDSAPAATCSGECPALPPLAADADGGASFDAILGLGVQDALVLSTCAAKLRACQLCIERGRKAGVVR